MITINSDIRIEYEITTYLNRKLLNERLTTVDKKYVEIADKIVQSYKTLESCYLNVYEKYKELFDLLTYVSEDNTWVGHSFFFILTSDQTKHSDKEKFKITIKEDLDGANTPYFDHNSAVSDKEFYELLNHSEIDKSEKWNLSLLYQNFDYYMSLFQSALKELSVPFSKELKKYKKEIEYFVSDWKKQLQGPSANTYIRDRFHLDIANDVTSDYNLYPSIFGQNSITYTEYSLYFGIIFDSSFEFSEEINEDSLIRYLRLLSDPSKFTIIKALLKQPMYGKELAEILNLTPATISHHMTDLSSGGLIHFVQGKNKRIYYHVDEDMMSQLEDAMHSQLFSKLKTK
ncbi:ArsR/SmtB family transcription factor [Breznakia pachnodae]|uniref:DNA-binding transcriptional ArsR family regulator n=1 Tax=Breznakia pachnodae TaxID=265178 RepID=A0ABU0DZA2_9FIRM|nr:metalloregulator ArsR/SmtB family transcription factor [Breznakia pachnodae]MDQ0359962.1 DNA-binding transcriptional ArsR family regulator [Breznakia pachnodae]